MNPRVARRPRVAFLTQNCFSQCDIPILPGLALEADVFWNVFYPRYDQVGNSEETLERIGREIGVITRIWRMRGRLRSLHSVRDFSAILNAIRRFRPDVVYVNAVGLPWLAPLMKLRIGARRVVWAVHDVRDHRYNRFYHSQTLYRAFLYKAFKRFHFLSRNQQRVFLDANPGKETHYAPHPPLDFGPRKGSPSPDVVQFLFFGYIAPRKGVDVLIRAAERLWDNGVGGFRISIAGTCDNWTLYQDLIRHPEIFDLDIRLVPNDKVVELYSTSHWLVMPYRDITQSGPMSLAYHYNVPTITSDLVGFGEFVQKGRTGLVFRLDDVDSLSHALRIAVEGGILQQFRENQAEFFRENFSAQHCLEGYRKFLLPKVPGLKYE